MTTVSPLASVAPGAILGEGCIIGPFAVIAAGVIIGRGAEIRPHAVIGLEPKGPTSRPIVFERMVSIGAGAIINPFVCIYYDVTVGAETLICEGASIREKCRIGRRCLISRGVTVNYNVFVGDDTKVMDLTHLTGNMRIGTGCFISLCVATTNDNAIGALPYDPDRVRGPIIEDGAAIGANATLLPGVRIGKGAVVAAGTIVTRDVPPGTLLRGEPGRNKGPVNGERGPVAHHPV